ncbi:unnamed protein product [Calypogeia fissa]
MVSALLWLMASAAMAGTTAVVMYLSYWGALLYGFISLDENGRPTLKPKNLPPGSMGVPMIGETLGWLRNQVDFWNMRWTRHGEIYKTHLFGFPTVVVTTHEAAKKLLISNADSLKGYAPDQVVSLLGSHFLMFLEGDQHLHLKKKIMKHLQPALFKSMAAAIEEIAIMHISSWSKRSNITFSDEIEKYTLGVGLLAFLGPLPSFSAAKLIEEFGELEKGFTSLPIKLPGFQYYASMQAKNRLLKEIHDIMNARQTEQNNNRPKDILDVLIDREDPSTQDVIDGNGVGLLFAAGRTTAGLIAFIVKHLHDHPDVLQDLKEEQEKIRSRKACGESLSWEDLKDMPFTYQVMQESMRLTNVVSLQYRLVEKELEFKGYVIPKNWRIISLHLQWHLDPKIFPDPYKLDPSRFQTPKLAFTPFGLGAHLCAGYEIARMEVLIFLHHFTTKFRWEIIKDGPTELAVFPTPYAGLPLKLTQL